MLCIDLSYRNVLMKPQSNSCVCTYRPCGFHKVEALKFQDSRHIKVVSL
jgi:hypothetical protein